MALLEERSIENGLVCSCQECQSSEDRRGDFTLSLLRIAHHRVRKMKGQSFSIRLYAVMLTTRKTSQSLLSSPPVLHEILVTSSAMEGEYKCQQRISNGLGKERAQGVL